MSEENRASTTSRKSNRSKSPFELLELWFVEDFSSPDFLHRDRKLRFDRAAFRFLTTKTDRDRSSNFEYWNFRFDELIWPKSKCTTWRLSKPEEQNRRSLRIKRKFGRKFPWKNNRTCKKCRNLRKRIDSNRRTAERSKSNRKTNRRTTILTKNEFDIRFHPLISVKQKPTDHKTSIYFQRIQWSDDDDQTDQRDRGHRWNRAETKNTAEKRVDHATLQILNKRNVAFCFNLETTNESIRFDIFRPLQSQAREYYTP